jgi:hypothetical protein
MAPQQSLAAAPKICDLLAWSYSTATVTVFDVTPYTAIDTGTELPEATPSGT